MGADRFHISEHNPNDILAGGCLCSPGARGLDTKGPFAVFYETDTDEPYSPHAVGCASCIIKAAEQLKALQADEPAPVHRRKRQG